MSFSNLKPLFQEYHNSHFDLIFFDKPSGLNTHAPDFGKWGLVEILEKIMHKKLYVVHRLDKATSGVITFAQNDQGARKLAELFETHQVEKEYVFLTDKNTTAREFKITSWIGKDRGIFVSKEKGPENNSETHFEFINDIGPYFLWKAKPTTGKPHQIRLHAELSQIPILGDEEHGGSPFFRICLHSRSIKFKMENETISHVSQLPIWTQQYLPSDEWATHEAFELRKNLFGFSETNHDCMRMVHRELNSFRMDQYGDTFWVYWYLDRDLSEHDLHRFRQIAMTYQRKLFVRKMLNRGEDSQTNTLWNINHAVDRWIANENQVRFELRSDCGLSPGLFLDQRENRLWVRNNSEKKKVLNLFSYTGGFSVNSALGGAHEVVSVDVSENFNSWAKRNFELNELKPENYEFWNQDSLLFLKGCYTRKRKFDLIICDPPSFGRSKNGIFSISKNLEELLIQCLFNLNGGGIILFSTNYEKWSIFDLKKAIEKLKKDFQFWIEDAPPTGLDFEMPGNSSLMKSLLIHKK